ncbi:MAG: hypothetical protein CMJ83_05140 [Planctomycetes bacterium]|nr:hypothetical protein [Planctomycetota bacterium]
MSSRELDLEDLYRLAAGELDEKRAAEIRRQIGTSQENEDTWKTIQDESDLLSLMKRHLDSLPTEDSTVREAPVLPDGYRFVKVVRRGGQGIVCQAIQESTERTVAIKIIHTPEDGGSAAARMEREFEIVRRLQHPAIVRLYDSGIVAGMRYLAMEFIEGKHLDAWLEERQPTINEKAILLVKMCRAVHHAHQRGIIHRDLKPSNILVDEQGDPHILDFGIAKPTFGAIELRSLTKTGEFAGTLPYASPEQLSGNPDLVDVRTDVHALGLLLYEALAMRHAWHQHVSIADLIRAITELQPTPLSEVAVGIDPDLEAIVARALEKDPDRRNPSAESLERELLRWLRGDPVEARGAGRWYLLRKTLAKNRLFVVALTALFLVLVASTTVCWWFWKREEDSASRAERAEEAMARQKREVEQALQEHLQLGDVLKVRALLVRQRELWPVGPDLRGPCEKWIAGARAIKDNERVHADALDRLRSRALPYSDAEKQRGYPDEFQSLLRLQERLSRLSADAPEREEFESMRNELEAVISLRLHWSYADSSDAFFEEQLGRLLDLLFDLDGARRSVQDRLNRSREIIRRTVDDEHATWEDCLSELAAEPRFQGVEIEPVPGLIPLGRDGTSGLWAFWHVESGGRPRRDEANQRWIPGPDGGLVLLLLPGGTFRMGASPPSDGVKLGQPNIDPWADSTSGPVHPVELRPFFMSQYEMTKGQWRGFRARELGRRPPGLDDADRLVLPVDNVSWVESDRVVRALGLQLPTEAQWEYACRAGTSFVFFTGNDIASLRGHANIFDEGSCGGLAVIHQNKPTPDFDDDYPFLAPVGSLKPNPFGLYHMIGNVAEWCQDWYVAYLSHPPRAGDGLRSDPSSRGRRVERGGSFVLVAKLCTSAQRHHAHPEEALQSLGVRPVLSLR